MLTSRLIDRRRFLQGAGLAYSSLLSGRKAFALSLSDAIYASAFQTPDRAFRFAIFAEDGQILSEHNLTGRGHGLASSNLTG